MQSLEEKVIIVAKAIVNEDIIWIDGIKITPREIGKTNTGGKTFVSTAGGTFIINESSISLTWPPPALKACAHCGASAQGQTKGELGDRLHQVICSNCLMCTPWCSTEKAVDAIWNRRTA